VGIGDSQHNVLSVTMHGIVTDITDIIVYNWYGCVRHSLVYIWHETELPDCQIARYENWLVGSWVQHEPVQGFFISNISQ